MHTKARTSLLALAGGLLLVGYAFSTEPQQPRSSDDAPDGSKVVKKPDHGVSLETARDRAELMHSIYEATLESIHHRYFRRGMGLLPARAMEDVFGEMAEKTKVEAKWIAVTFPAMGLDHEPEGDFEREAARQISAGKAKFEKVDKAYYLRAGAISLGSGCVGCHAAGRPPRKPGVPSYAGLVIRVPLKSD